MASLNVNLNGQSEEYVNRIEKIECIQDKSVYIFILRYLS